MGKEGSRGEGGGPVKGVPFRKGKVGTDGAFKREKCETPPFFSLNKRRRSSFAQTSPGAPAPAGSLRRSEGKVAADRQRYCNPGGGQWDGEFGFS